MFGHRASRFPPGSTVDPYRAQVQYAPDALETVEDFCIARALPMPDGAKQTVDEYSRAVLNILAAIITERH